MSDDGFTWHDAKGPDDLKAFYLSIQENVKQAANRLGYGIAVHGSLKRDFDLLAVPWVENHATADELARAIQEAACGMHSANYRWEAKPCGRMATCFPICWTELRLPSSGHIDLSVMPAHKN